MAHLHQHAHAHRHPRSLREGVAMLETRETPSRTTVMERSPVELVPRATDSCGPDGAACRKPTSTATLPIVLAVVIPCVLIACLLFYLHRRHVRKLREEDTNDPHKSLDFGMDAALGSASKGRKAPEMTLTDTEKSLRHNRNISMEMGSPYMLPAGLNHSRESFHSLSRSLNDPHDPYRPVTFIKGDDYGSRSGSPMGRRGDNGSMYTSSSGATDRMNNGLLKNAQRMSQSYPPRGESISPQDRAMPEIKFPEPAATQQRSPSPLNPNGQFPPPPPPPAGPLPDVKKPGSPEPNNEYAAFKPNAPAAVNVQTATAPPPLARIASQQAVVTETNTMSMLSTSSYGDGFKVTPPSPPHHERVLSDPTIAAPEPLRRPNESAAPVGLGVDEFGQNTNRLSMSLRPLPPDDPTDNAEQRANRIRSFYKEYFDDSKPEPAGAHIYNDYYEDYGSEYLDGTVFDPNSGAFIVAQPPAPYAQPVTRRAMTPPPRAPPRFRAGSNPRGPHMSGGSSMASSGFQRPRGMSSMSGQMAGPRRPLPPPTPLSSLPTPAKLKEDSMVFNPVDFAPPVSIRQLQNGSRPDSPLGSPRPYSPSVRPHTPLISAFEDMPAMPSPHLLRKSGTFTSLDFAPPPRFRDPGSGGSDAGSIRSNRSGMSTNARMAVRNGAYRVSKIPKSFVSTKDDMLVNLRPTMDMVSKA